MQNVQLHNTIWKQYVYVYIYGAISKRVNWIMYKHVVHNRFFFILNTSLTIMVRGMEHNINK